MIDIFRKRVSIGPIRTIDDLAQCVKRVGFLPMFACGIRGYSVYENTPGFWSDDGEGPWEWKGPMIQTGDVAYGKFFNRKAGYISRDWLPDFLNYRRSKQIAPNDDAAALDDIVLQTVHSEGRVSIKELRQLLGLGRRKRLPGELVVESDADVKVNLDTNLTRLMMEGRICIADFVYNIDKRGNPYGWGIAKYTTPEILYGRDIKADCSAEESFEKMSEHLCGILKWATKAQINKLLSI